MTTLLYQTKKTLIKTGLIAVLITSAVSAIYLIHKRLQQKIVHITYLSPRTQEFDLGYEKFKSSLQEEHRPSGCEASPVLHHVQVLTQDQQETTRRVTHTVQSQKTDIVLATTGMIARSAVQVAESEGYVTVFSAFSDPIATKIIRHPGKDRATGIRLDDTLSQARLDLFKEAFPTVHRILVISDPHWAERAVMLNVFGEKNIVEAEDSATLEKQLGKIRIKDFDGIYVPATRISIDAQKAIGDFIRNSGKPSIISEAGVGDFGASLAYYRDDRFISERLAWMTLQIICGTDPRDLPIEVPFRTILEANATQKINGLRVAKSVLSRADKILANQD